MHGAQESINNANKAFDIRWVQWRVEGFLNLIVKVHKAQDDILELNIHLKQFKKLCKKDVDFYRNE